MKISVTGASGFIGSSLCDELLSLGHEVTILSRKDRSVFAGVTVVKGDLLADGSHLDDFICGADVVYHCAGEIKNQQLMPGLHIDGTRRLLSAVQKSVTAHGKPIHWIQLSSVGAYGIHEGDGVRRYRDIDEETPERPSGVYEVTKTESDKLVREFAAAEPLFRYTIVRPTIVIGSGMPNESFHAMARMIKHRLFFWIGTNKTIANYVHVGDVVRALILCMADVRAQQMVFIVANDCPFREVVEALATAMQVPIPRFVVPERPLRLLVKLLSPFVGGLLTSGRIDALTRHIHYSAELINQTLQFTPQASIQEIIPQLVEESKSRLNLR